MAEESYIFGGGSGLSYEQLKQRRAIAQALASRQKGFPKNKGEGMTYLGESIGEALQDLALQRAEKRQQSRDLAAVNPKFATDPKPEAKIDTPQTTTAAPPAPAVIDRPPPPPVQAAPAPAPAPPPVTQSSPSQLGGPWTAPAITAPPPWPTSEATPPEPDMPPFAQRFADAVPSAPPPSAPAAQQENTFFQPELATPSFSGGTVADLTPADIPPMPAQRASITAPAPPPMQQNAMLSPAADPQMMMLSRQQEQPPPAPVSEPPPQAPIDVASSAPVPSPDVPLPRGDPRTVGGVQATMRNEFARAGYTPTAIGGTMPNARDESGFNWSDASRHIDQHNPKFAGTEAMYSHGLFQEGGDDWNKMQAWLDKNYPGYSRQDPALQSRFTAENLKESTPKAFEAMQNAPTEGQAADAMLRGYLRPSAPNVASRSAAYLAGTGAQPAPATAIAMGGGGGMRDREGSPVQADPRDAVTAALLDQPVQQPQQVAEEQQPQTSDARLLEMLGGGRRPGSPFLPTASIGREGNVRSDAPLPGLSPMGSLNDGVGASVQERRDAITRAVIDQPVTAPEVPQPDPTQSGTSPSPTTASLPPTSPSVISDSSTVPPMGATAQAAMPMAPPVGYGSVGTLVPPQQTADTSQAIRPAPAAGQAPPTPDVPTVAKMQDYPEIGPRPLPPKPSNEMLYWQNQSANPMVSETVRAIAGKRYEDLKKEQDAQYNQDFGLWKDRFEKREAYRLGLPKSQEELATATYGAEKARRDLEGEGFFPIPPDKMAALKAGGFQPVPGQLYYQNRRGELKTGPAPPASIVQTIDQKGETEFSKVTNKALAESFVKKWDEGSTAATDLATITQLRERSAKVNTGAGAAVQQLLGNWGIKTEGLSDIQSFNALINRLVPQQRVAGSGSTSNYEDKMYREGLPKIINTQEGNQLAMDTIEMLAKNRLDQADIAGKVVSGEITPREGVQQTRDMQLQIRAQADKIKEHIEKNNIAMDNEPEGTIQQNPATKEFRIKRDNKWEPYSGR